MTEWKASETDGKTKEDFLKLLGPDKNRLIVFYCAGHQRNWSALSGPRQKICLRHANSSVPRPFSLSSIEGWEEA